jgi:hypothetical protein
MGANLVGYRKIQPKNGCCSRDAAKAAKENPFVNQNHASAVWLLFDWPYVFEFLRVLRGFA